MVKRVDDDSVERRKKKTGMKQVQRWFTPSDSPVSPSILFSGPIYHLSKRPRKAYGKIYFNVFIFPE